MNQTAVVRPAILISKSLMFEYNEIMHCLQSVTCFVHVPVHVYRTTNYALLSTMPTIRPELI